MRLRTTVMLASMLAGLLPVGTALATGNVLLPTDNSNGSSMPNLGLTPTIAPPEASAPPPPQPTEAPAQAKPIDQLPAPATVTPTAPPALPGLQMPLPAPTYPAQQPMPNSVQPRLPYAIKISLIETGIWSQNDITTVNSQLGLPPAFVKAECTQGINGMLITDRGTYNVDSFFGTSINQPFDGTVTNAMLNVVAACTSAPKPAPYSYIQHIGDRYIISLGSAFCTPNTPFTGSSHQLFARHTGNGNDSCAFQ